MTCSRLSGGKLKEERTYYLPSASSTLNLPHHPSPTIIDYYSNKCGNFMNVENKEKKFEQGASLSR